MPTKMRIKLFNLRKLWLSLLLLVGATAIAIPGIQEVAADGDEVAEVNGTKYGTLQAAVEAAQNLGGSQTISLIGDVSSETVTINEVANFKLTIDGKKDESSNYTVDARIVVDGLRGKGGSITNGASVTLQNIAFVNSQAINLIKATNYSHNLTIQDCSYTGSSSSSNNWFLNVTDDSKGATMYGLIIKNVTIESSRLIQGSFSSEVVFENIIATTAITAGFNIKTGNSGGLQGTVLIKDCQVTTAKYAFRDYADSYDGTITLKGNTFISTSTESDEGAIVNRGGKAGINHINVESGSYEGQIVFIKTEYKDNGVVTGNNEGVLAISGGYFSKEFPQSYIAADLVAQGKVCAPATDKPGFFTVGDPHYVAQIGETKYASLQAALDAAHEMTGDVTVELLDNISSYSIVHQKAGLNLTIDGKENTVAGQIFIDGNGRASGTETLTIKNIQFEGNTTNFYSGTDAFILVPSTKDTGKPWTTGAYNYAHNVTVTDCSFTSTSTSSAYDVVCYKSTSAAGEYNVTINNCTASGTMMHSLAQLTGTTGGTITNCTVTGSESFVNVSGGTGDFTISGNTFTSDENASAGYGIRENGSSTAVITLTDNNFTAANAVLLGKTTAVTAGTINVESGIYTGVISKTEAATGKIVVSGGYFSEEVAQDYIVEGKVCVSATDKPGYFTIGDPTYVAQIGETKYTNLAKAVEAVTAGTETTIVMIDDETIVGDAGVTIPSGKNVVLDLNGKTVKGIVQNPTSAQTILNKGTLTITDNSDEKDGTITNEVSDENAGSPGNGKNWFSNVITNNGTLTVNAGNISNTGTGGACYAIDNITNGTICTPVLNIAGGNISAKKVAVRMFCNSTTNDNTVNVTGGTITSENAYAIQTQMANNSANKATLNISGGTLSGQYAWVDYGNKDVATQFDNAHYNITGGFFSGDLWSYATYYCGMDGFISGGLFSTTVGGDLVKPGSACVDNTDEATKVNYPYTIGLADVHYYWLDNSGNIDGGGYYTIYAPFAGPDPVLMDGEFVVLQKNITLTKDIEYIEEVSFGDPIYKGGTFSLKFGEYDIDLNGFKFPIPTGVTILTDKQTNIFSALEEGYKVIETTVENGYSYTVEDDVSDIQTSYYPVTADYKIQNKGTHRFVDVKGTYYAKPDVAFVEDADYIHVGVGVQNLDANGVADGTWKTYSLSAENPAPRAGDPTTIEVFSYVGKAIKLATQLAVDHIGRLVDAHAGSSGIITDSNKESIKTALNEIAQAAIELYANDYGYLTLVPQADNSVMVKATIPVIPESVDAACQKITGKSAWEWAKSEVVEYINTKNPDETLSAYVLNNLDNVSPGNTYYLTAESNRSFGYVLESQVASVGDNAYWILADQKNVETPKIADGEYQIQNVDTKYFVNVYGQYQAEPNIEAIDILTDQTLEANSMITLKSGRYDYSDDNLFQIYELANGSQNVAAYLAKAVNVVKALADAKFTEKQDQIDKVLNMLKDYGVEITDEQLKSDVNLAIDLYAGRYGNVKLQDNGDETVSLFVDVPAIPAEEMVNTAYEKLAGGYDSAWEWAKAQVVNYFSDGHSPNISADFVSRNLAKVNPGKTYYLSAKADKTFDFVEHAAQDYSVTDAEKWLLTKVTPETTDIDLYDNVTDFPDDYKTYWFTEDTQVKSVTYHRKFKGTQANKYQPWFVPFDYKTTGEEGGDFYSLHFVAASGSQTGVVEDPNAVYIYIRKMETGATLKANKPYVFKPAAENDEGKFVAENVTLTAPKTDIRFHVESAEYNYDFYGTYDDAYPAREAGKGGNYYLFLNGGKISWNKTANGHLMSYRWYVVPTARDAYSEAKPLMFVEDVPEATGVNNATINISPEIEGIYSPNGVKLDEPALGVNIVRYTNGTTKKIIIK